MVIRNLRSGKMYAHSFSKTSQSKYSFEIPEKYKDKFIGKWALFWRNLYLDYKEVAVETLTKSREKPKNAVLTLAGVAGALYCCSANPDERSYRDAVQASSQELALVGAPIRNPATCRHLHRANTCLDKGEVRRLGLGLLCLVWADTRDAGLGVYAAQCPHLRPHPRDWPRLLLDVGFLDRWWLLRRAMHDCDVNPAG